MKVVYSGRRVNLVVEGGENRVHAAFGLAHGADQFTVEAAGIVEGCGLWLFQSVWHRGEYGKDVQGLLNARNRVRGGVPGRFLEEFEEDKGMKKSIYGPPGSTAL